MTENDKKKQPNSSDKNESKSKVPADSSRPNQLTPFEVAENGKTIGSISGAIRGRTRDDYFS